MWIYLLKHKSNVFDTFKKWKAKVKNETSLKIKCLRSDNGGEYDKSEFKAFWMNRTLNERSKSMMIHSRLPKTFLVDVVNTAGYLINKG